MNPFKIVFCSPQTFFGTHEVYENLPTRREDMPGFSDAHAAVYRSVAARVNAQLIIVVSASVHPLELPISF